MNFTENAIKKETSYGVATIKSDGTIISFTTNAGVMIELHEQVISSGYYADIPAGKKGEVVEILDYNEVRTMAIFRVLWEGEKNAYTTKTKAFDLKAMKKF